jgi:competence protein ComEC
MTEEINRTSITIIVLSCFVIGVGLAVLYPGNIYIQLILIPLLIAALFFDKKLKLVLLLATLLFLTGFNYTKIRTINIESYDISNFTPLKNAEITGKIINEPRDRTDSKLEFYFAPDKIIVEQQTIPVTGKLRVSIFDKLRQYEVLGYGNKLKLKGNIYLPDHATNPYEFDYRNYLLHKGITANMYVYGDNYQLLSPADGLYDRLLNSLNLMKNHIQNVHVQALNEKEAQLLGGIVLGERAIPMDKELKQIFINSGLVHILAASGINVALLALAWIFITSRLALPYPFQIVGGMIIVIIYALLTGLPPSVLRASIMLEFILIGKLMNKNADMVSLIVFVAALLLLYNPYMINDIGFQLSFITALGLIISVPIVQKYVVTIPQVLAMLVLIPFIAQIWALPVLLFHFHNLATYSILANFCAMPLVAGITYSGFISSVISVIPAIGWQLATIIDKIIQPVLSLLIYIAEYFASLPMSVNHFAINTIVGVLFCYLIIGIVLYLMHKNMQWKPYAILVSSIILILLVTKIIQPVDTKLTVIFFDTGDSDATYIKTPSGKHVLIDGGKRVNDNYNSADWVIKPFLYSSKVPALDLVILTHPQNDHIGGLPEIMEEMKVKNYVDTGPKTDHRAYNDLIRRVQKNNIPYSVLRAGDIIDFQDGVKFLVLSPSEKRTSVRKVNENSLVVKLVYDKISFLFTGDSEVELLNVVQSTDIDVDILKVGHHGSKDCINDKYLNYTSPQLAIIPAGYRQFKYTKETIELLDKHKIQTFITLKHGAVEIKSDGKTFQYRTFNKDSQE